MKNDKDNLFETSKLILIYFQPGDGAKFLSSCLSLASNSIIPRVDMVNGQIEKKPSQEEKFNYYFNVTSDETISWNDFLISPASFILSSNRSEHAYNAIALDFLKKYAYCNFDPADFIIPDKVCNKIVSNKDIFFFGSTHNLFDLYVFSKAFKNCIILNFKNGLNFSNNYRKNLLKIKQINESNSFGIYRKYINNLKTEYNKIKGCNWPSFKKFYKDYENNFSDEFKKELVNDFPLLYNQFRNMLIYKKFFAELKTGSIENHKIITWDCMHYVSKKETLENIKKVYEKIGLEDFNEELLGLLYDKWKQKSFNSYSSITSNININFCVENIKKYKNIGNLEEAKYYIQQAHLIMENK